VSKQTTSSDGRCCATLLRRKREGFAADCSLRQLDSSHLESCAGLSRGPPRRRKRDLKLTLLWWQGTVMGDLNKRKGIIMGSEQEGDDTVLQAHVPLASMFGYSTDLRSMTQARPPQGAGRASAHCHPAAVLWNAKVSGCRGQLETPGLSHRGRLCSKPGA